MSPHPYILLAEDNDDDVRLTERAFRSLKIVNPLVVVRDGAEALDFLLDGSGDPKCPPRGLPQVVLLDIRMPKLSGIEVLERLRAHPRTKLLPVVMLTTSVDDRDLVLSYNHGANSFIQKPVDWGKFLDAMRDLSLYWLVINKAPRER